MESEAFSLIFAKTRSGSLLRIFSQIVSKSEVEIPRSSIGRYGARPTATYRGEANWIAISGGNFAGRAVPDH